MSKTSTQDATPTVSAPPVPSDEKASDHWYTLVKWDDLSHWRQDNHYIQGYYRRDSGSILRSFGSLAYWHNETINIYSHLIPALLSLPCAVAIYKLLQPRYEQATKSDVTAFCCFFLGAALCLGMSATYHTISNHSPMVNQIGNQLDYVGIVLLITGSFVPCVYYGFWCAPTLQKVYWAMVSWTRVSYLICPAETCYRSLLSALLAQSCPFCNDFGHPHGDLFERLCL